MPADADGTASARTVAPCDALPSTESDLDRLRQAATATHDRVREEMEAAYSDGQTTRFEELDNRRVRLNEYRKYLQLAEKFASY